MDFKLPVVSIIVLISMCSASILPTVKVLQGPGSKTILLGPDGSAINSAAPGGTVVTDAHGSGLVAAGPAVLPSAPAIIVNGPAGSIATSYSLAGPAIVPAAAPAAVGFVASPALGGIVLGAPLGEGSDASGNSDGEGAYVPDKWEALYDDGSYKGEH